MRAQINNNCNEMNTLQICASTLPKGPNRINNLKTKSRPNSFICQILSKIGTPPPPPPCSKTLKLASVLAVSLTTVLTAQTTPTRNIIVLDPAHGGADMGAKITAGANGNLAEKDLTLSFTARLKPLLAAAGFTVITTPRRRSPRNHPTHSRPARRHCQPRPCHRLPHPSRHPQRLRRPSLHLHPHAHRHRTHPLHPPSPGKRPRPPTCPKASS